MSGVKSREKAARDLELAVKEAKTWIEVGATGVASARPSLAVLLPSPWLTGYLPAGGDWKGAGRVHKGSAGRWHSAMRVRGAPTRAFPSLHPSLLSLKVDSDHTARQH